MTDTAAYIDLLRQLVRIPSPTFGEDAAASLLCGTLDSWGLSPKRLHNNIVCLSRNFDPSAKTLALDAHIDTVPASGGYTRDPFDPGMDDGVVYGLGSNDDGGSVVSMIAAFRHFFDSKLHFNLMLVLTSEEERSGDGGAAWLYSHDGPLSGRESLPSPDWVIVGEPTGMKAATSEKGLLVLDGEAHGVGGHAARGDGKNALYIALDDIAALRAHGFARVSPISGKVMLNVTQIQAGSAHNVIPDSCRFTVDIRTNELYTPQEVLSELQGICSSTLTPRKLSNFASATLEGSPLLAALSRLGVHTYSSPTTSDWMRLGRDAVKIGPGDSSRSHKADEYILASEIAAGIGGYIEFIEELDNGYTLE